MPQLQKQIFKFWEHVNIIVILSREMHEGAVFLNLKRRFDREIIYVIINRTHTFNAEPATKCPKPANFTSNQNLDFTKIYFAFKFCFFCLSLLFVVSQTYIGSILLSVNPYKMYNIYGTDMVLLYNGCALGENPP